MNIVMSGIKTISISPELFKISTGGKTKNQNKTVSRIPSLNKNSSLRENLLKRLNKNRINDTRKNHVKTGPSIDKHSKQSTNINRNNNSEKKLEEDELKSSMKYLSEKAEYKRVNPSTTSIAAVETNKNRTLKNNDGSIKYNIENDVPYGCLKGGTKPTFRNWVKTLKNTPNKTEIDFMSNNNLTDQEKYTLIKKKLQKIQSSQNTQNNTFIQPVQQIEEPLEVIKIPELIQPKSIQPKSTQFEESKEIIKIPELIQPTPIQIEEPTEIIKIPELLQSKSIQIEEPTEIIKIPDIQTEMNFLEKDEKLTNPDIISSEKELVVIPVKKTFKKKIKRTYTIGKNIKKRQVGLLLKNSQTMKKIMTAHNNLKNEPIDKVEKYLRTHGFKVKGSSCPQDVTRKMYESAMLSGDIFNKNKDIYLQNMKQDET